MPTSVAATQNRRSHLEVELATKRDVEKAQQKKKGKEKVGKKTHKMINAILMSYLLLLLGTQAKAAVANAAIKPLSQRGIIFPKESFDDCFTDDHRRVPGNCKLLEDCPAALRRWNEQSVLPKTCYFVKYDQFVCCDLHDNNSTTPTTPTIQPEPEPEPQLRSSEQACEDSKIFGISIVGGRPAKYGEFPYMAALGWQANFDGSILYRCGGTLIAPTFVLTAAHCINFGGQLPATVRLGGENLTEGMGENHAIRRVFTHPDYTDTGAYNDIALLELDATQPSSRTIVCLWQSPELPMDGELTAIGYGQIQFAGLSSKQLLKVSLQHVTQQQCQPHYQLEDLPQGLALSQMCAGDLRGVGDTCQGDSGGPLLMRSKNQWFVVGITSLGQGCASGPPSIYTRVSSYLDWIESIVWPKAEVGPQQPTFDLRMND